jgi:DNA-binding MarR family transcriptional regulator
MVHLMADNANLGGLADIRRTVAAANPSEVVETEMALLQRALERLGRRSDIHRDLDRASYLLARTLEAAGPISLKDLAGRLGLDATTVTRQIASMEARGLVDRRAEPDDGRVSLIGLSGAGRRKMRAVQRARRERVQDLLAGWPARDQAELGRLLARLTDAIGDMKHTIPTRRGALAPDTRRA